MGDIKNLQGTEAAEKLKDFTEGNPVMLCTFTGSGIASRPMGAMGVDEDGTVWFFSHRGSNKNRQLAANPAAHITYADKGSVEFLSIEGTAVILRDQARIDELWNPFAKTWFTGGKDDPELTLIKFTPTEGHYWDVKHNKMVALAKIAVGAIAGKTIDDGLEGDIRF